MEVISENLAALERKARRKAAEELNEDDLGLDWLGEDIEEDGELFHELRDSLIGEITL